MADVKMTRAMALEMAIGAVADEEAKAVLAKIKASVEKKNTGSSKRKATPGQTWLRNAIAEVLGASETSLSVGEILDRIDKDSIPENVEVKLSTSSITSNIGVTLRNGKTPNPNGTIVRELSGKVAKFRLATEEEMAEGADEE